MAILALFNSKKPPFTKHLPGIIHSLIFPSNRMLPFSSIGIPDLNAPLFYPFSSNTKNLFSNPVAKFVSSNAEVSTEYFQQLDR